VTAHWNKGDPSGIPPRIDWRFERTWASDARSLRKTFLDWVEDSKGRWIADAKGYESGHGTGGSSGVFSGRLDNDAPPATFVVGVVEGRDEVTLPFVIRGFDEPP
jgi:hypothetical protein